MKGNVIKEKSFLFALRVVKCYQYIQSEHKEFVLSKQFLRSGTAIGALVKEAIQAESKADFIHKLAIGLKEASETEYWLELLFESGYLEKNEYGNIHSDCQELLKLLTAIIKSSRNG